VKTLQEWFDAAYRGLTVKIMQRLQVIAKNLLPLVKANPFTDKELLEEIQALGPMPEIKILNASLDLGGHGLYKVKFFQSNQQVAQYTQARVTLQSVHAAAVLQAKIKHYDYIEISVLSSEEPTP
jgi:hypothetical protein